MHFCLFFVFFKPEPVDIKYLKEIGYKVKAPLKYDSYTISDEWAFIGPEDYISTGQTFSGRAAYILLGKDRILYVATAQGGVWKSEDNGANWSVLTDGLSSLSSGALCFSPFDSSIIYYGTGEMHFSGDCYFGDGLFRTDDEGQTWHKVAAKERVGAYISHVFVSSLDSNTIFISSDRGFLKSNDNGKTWNEILKFSWATDMAVMNDTVFVALHSNGIYRSVDNGETFTKLSGLPNSGFARINFAFSSDHSVIYASFVANDGSLYGIYKSIDNGDNWQKLENVPNYLASQGWYDNCIAVDPTNPDICYAGGVYPYRSGYYGLVKTEDGGNTWNDVTVGVNGVALHPDQHFLAINSSGVVYVANDGGIWRSEDRGATWINMNKGLATLQFYSIDVYSETPSTVMGGTQDNGTLYTTGELEWKMVSGGDGGGCAFETGSLVSYTSYINLNPLWKFVGWNYYGEVTGPWDSDRTIWTYNPVEASPNEKKHIYVATHRVWETKDGGTNWYNISEDLTGNAGSILSLSIAKDNPQIILTGSSNGYIYITENNGASWKRVYKAANEISGIAVSPDATDIIVSNKSSSGERVIYSKDKGETWEDITGNFPEDLRVLTLTCAFFETGFKIFLGTDYGVYFSSDTGKTYSYYGNLPRLAIYKLKYHSASKTLTAATHGRGMWQIDVDDFSSIVERAYSLRYFTNREVIVYSATGERLYIGRYRNHMFSSGIYYIKEVSTNRIYKYIIIR